MRCLQNPWIRFLRLPALYTVPGDVWVGAALAQNPLLWRPLFAVCFAYLFGMALNDLVDESRDRESRPERPLPSGRIRKSRAWMLCGTLALGAVLLFPRPAMLGLLLLISVYNFVKQRQLIPGALCMAGCRGMALWIGAGAPASLKALLPGFVIWGGLIFLITLLADQEGRVPFSGGWMARMLTAGWLLAPLPALLLGTPRFPVFLPWALLAALALQNYRQILDQEKLLPRNTGQWLSMLIPLQSAFLFALAPLWQGALILCLWPLLRGLIRQIQIS
ncbi:MAG: UbiA family prenyltransferase [Kiritimatiellia bacterium]